MSQIGPAYKLLPFFPAGNLVSMSGLGKDLESVLQGALLAPRIP